MVLRILEVFYTQYFQTKGLVPILISLAALVAIRVYAQGRFTTRERDLHARTILLTGAFTPLGLVILQELASRGAHVIALSDEPIDSASSAVMIVGLLRSTTSNEQIYADYCKDQRLDAIIYAHEYQHIGPVIGSEKVNNDALLRDACSLATFLMTTLLLPALLVAPVERDIRIIHVINRFYAAAASPGASSGLPSSFPSITPSPSSPPQSKSVFFQEGTRALRTVILARHLQRVLDALPTAQVPQTEEGSSAVPVASTKVQKSNVVAVSVSPGVSRLDTVAPLLNADWTRLHSRAGIYLYLLLLPVLHLFTKPPYAAAQTILHALFLPTAFKVAAARVESDQVGISTGSAGVARRPQEVLKPGALYAECAVVPLNVPPPPKEAEREREAAQQKEGASLPDDGELGGELGGRLVWEAYETALKAWEKANPPLPEEDTPKTPSTENPSAAPVDEAKDVYA
ncbi:hypothetical protein FISHEDRAFT_68640 [Fistulina hepatica ATCC 64428]|uniref:Ketoreductase (KR) domain-containing protein n=1 Tax=Fistulina hepatica ATCC 64428 TaxID=1128425 RepID=A0A0D7APE6_9AGAR|nr:hypothetical protein FISHEDRAFT_68640 [Fistulina hepatica ATCC 64428]